MKGLEFFLSDKYLISGSKNRSSARILVPLILVLILTWVQSRGEQRNSQNQGQGRRRRRRSERRMGSEISVNQKIVDECSQVDRVNHQNSPIIIAVHEQEGSRLLVSEEQDPRKGRVATDAFSSPNCAINKPVQIYSFITRGDGWNACPLTLGIKLYISRRYDPLVCACFSTNWVESGGKKEERNWECIHFYHRCQSIKSIKMTNL